MPPALDHQHLRRAGRDVELVPVQDPAMDDEIVALAIREIAEHRLQDAFALAHVHQLIALRIAIEVRVLLVRLDIEHRHVAIEHQRDPIQRRTPPLAHATRQEVPMPQR
jgi:hypothetical protein